MSKTYSIFKLQYSSGSQICNKLINLILFFIFKNWFYFDLTVHSFLSQQHFINLDISHWNSYLGDFIFFLSIFAITKILEYKINYQCICFTRHEVWRTSRIYNWCINQSWQHLVYITAYQSLLSNQQLFPAYLSTFLWWSNPVEVIR